MLYWSLNSHCNGVEVILLRFVVGSARNFRVSAIGQKPLTGSDAKLGCRVRLCRLLTNENVLLATKRLIERTADAHDWQRRIESQFTRPRCTDKCLGRSVWSCPAAGVESGLHSSGKKGSARRSHYRHSNVASFIGYIT